MAQPFPTQAVASLRAINYRISSAPPKELPLIITQVAGSLWRCKDILSTPSDFSKSTNEAATAVHRLKTSLTSLFQDGTIEGRWTAVVLAKATVEAGGVEILSKSNPWVRGLLAILKKPDPPNTRTLAIITLTRIFMLTWDYSNLVREITMPALPAYISTCLGNVGKDRCGADELQTVLEAFATLIPRHPTIFRTNGTQIRSILVTILSRHQSYHTQSQMCAAQRLLVLLHHCAPKQGGGDKWDESFRSAMVAAHATCDKLLRSVVENWQPATGNMQTTSTSTLSAGEVGLESEDAVGLSGWNAVFAGSERLVTLLGLLQSHLDVPTACSMSVRTGLIIDLLTRLCNVTVSSAQAKPEIPKAEREALLSVLPTIRVAALELMNAVLERFGKGSTPFLQSLMELATDVYRSEGSDTHVKAVTYRILKTALGLSGPSMPKEDIAELGTVIKGCCDDLLLVDNRIVEGPNAKANGLSANMELGLKAQTPYSSHNASRNDPISAASALLPALFAQINPACMPRKLRAQMDRTAILTRNKEALIASVLNPGKRSDGGPLQTSLLPLLAREYPDSPEVEAMLRPRIPPIFSSTSNGGEDINGYDDDEDEVVDVAEAGETRGGRRHDGEDDEPADDLLHGTDQNAGTAFGQQEDDDLYSATPPPDRFQRPDQTPLYLKPEPEVLPSDKWSTKRSAEESADAKISAKRLRASPVAKALAEASSAALPGPDPATFDAQVPVTAVMAQPTMNEVSAEKTVTLPAPSMVDEAGGGEPTGDVGSDDSDFEMPPLTLEPDTDPEEEEEEL